MLLFSVAPLQFGRRRMVRVRKAPMPAVESADATARNWTSALSRLSPLFLLMANDCLGRNEMGHSECDPAFAERGLCI